MKHFLNLALPAAILAALLAALLAAILSGCISQRQNEDDYGNSFKFGEAMGYRGLIRVKVCIENGYLSDITVIESGEDRAVGGEAIDELIDLVIMYNSTEIDAISGATETSRGFLQAVENAMLSHE